MATCLASREISKWYWWNVEIQAKQLRYLRCSSSRRYYAIQVHRTGCCGRATSKHCSQTATSRFSGNDLCTPVVDVVVVLVVVLLIGPRRRRSSCWLDWKPALNCKIRNHNKVRLSRSAQESCYLFGGTSSSRSNFSILRALVAIVAHLNLIVCWKAHELARAARNACSGV